MKNIPIANLLDQLISRSNGVNWDDVVQLSRLEAGQPSSRTSTFRYAPDHRAAKIVVWKMLEARGYLVVDGIGNLKALLLRPQDDYIAAHVQFSNFNSNNSVSLAVVGDAQEAESIKVWFKDTFASMGTLIKTATSVDRDGDINYTSKYLIPAEERTAHNSFYPWLNVSLSDYFDAFLQSDEPVLVMFGPPGTGKSTFLRSLILHSQRGAVLAFNKDVIESPELITKFYQDRSAMILAFEDIDRHLGKRENDNTLMPMLLNAADGVVQHKSKKLVFVTNLPSIDRIDPALLRVGRCFDILQFRALSATEAGNVRKDLNLPAITYAENAKIPLAEVLSPINTARQSINRFANTMGFK